MKLLEVSKYYFNHGDIGSGWMPKGKGEGVKLRCGGGILIFNCYQQKVQNTVKYKIKGITGKRNHGKNDEKLERQMERIRCIKY